MSATLTRRAILAGVPTALTAASPVVALAVSADPVVAMCGEWTAKRQSADGLPITNETEDLWGALLGEADEIEDRIIATPAKSVRGALAKLRILFGQGDDFPDIDAIGYRDGLLKSAIADLERLAEGVG